MLGRGRSGCEGRCIGGNQTERARIGGRDEELRRSRRRPRTLSRPGLARIACLAGGAAGGSLLTACWPARTPTDKVKKAKVTAAPKKGEKREVEGERRLPTPEGPADAAPCLPAWHPAPVTMRRGLLGERGPDGGQLPGWARAPCMAGRMSRDGDALCPAVAAWWDCGVRLAAEALIGLRAACAVDPRAPKYNKLSSGRKCQLTGQKANNAMTVTFSHKRNHKLQQVNLQKKKVFWPEVSELPGAI